MNWRGFQLALAKVCIDQHAQGTRALVVDDSIKVRRSKKMDGVSIHFDHARHQCVTGHQVVSVGMSIENDYFPLDNELSIGRKGRQCKGNGKTDRHTVAQRRFKDAQQLSKLDLTANMVRRIVQKGIAATYLVADSRFGNKAMMKLVLDTGLTRLFRMKDGTLKYRVKGEHGQPGL